MPGPSEGKAPHLNQTLSQIEYLNIPFSITVRICFNRTDPAKLYLMNILLMEYFIPWNNKKFPIFDKSRLTRIHSQNPIENPRYFIFDRAISGAFGRRYTATIRVKAVNLIQFFHGQSAHDKVDSRIKAHLRKNDSPLLFCQRIQLR